MAEYCLPLLLSILNISYITNLGMDCYSEAMVSVLGQVFEEIQEYQYKPQLVQYIIKVFASNGYMEQVALVCIYWKSKSNLHVENEPFNAVFTTFLTSKLFGLVNM